MIFCATRYSAILVPPSPSSLTFSPAVFGGLGVEDSTVDPALSRPTSSPSTPMSARVMVLTSFFFAAMMPLKDGKRGSLIFSVTLTIAGSDASTVHRPSSVSRSPVILPPSTVILRMCVNCGSPRYSAMIAGTAPPVPSVASLPAITRSVPSMVPSARASAHPVCTMSEPCSCGSSRCTPRSAPMDSALRMASVARSGPAVSTVTVLSPPSFSLISSASSTARSLISSSTASAASRSRVKSPVVSLRSDHVSGTCLIRTTMLVMAGVVLLAGVVRPVGRTFWVTFADHSMLPTGNFW